MAAVPDLGRATGVQKRVAPEAAATQDLYERYAGQIFSFCLHKLGNREEAEDAVQQTFLNAFRGLRRGIDVETESAWLFKIAHNVCLTRRRSAWRRGKVETPNDLEALQEFVAAPPTMGADDLIQLQDALAAMPATQRKAILLREWQGLSYDEIAEQMEISQPAVETLIFRARRTLAQGLEQAPGERRGWRRARQSMDVGSVLAAAKAALLGGAAAKVAVTTAAVTALAVVPAGIEQNRIAPTPLTRVARQPVVDERPVPAPLSAAFERSFRPAAPKVVPVAKATAKPQTAPVPVASAPPPAPAPAAEPPVAAVEPKEAPAPKPPKAEEPKVEQPQATPHEPVTVPLTPLPEQDGSHDEAAAPVPGEEHGSHPEPEPAPQETHPQQQPPEPVEQPVVEPLPEAGHDEPDDPTQDETGH